MIRIGGDDAYDEKYGRFMQNQRFNVDQVPLPFAIEARRTYEVIDEEFKQAGSKTAIKRPGAGLEKRQCSMQVTINVAIYVYFAN